MKWCGRMWFMPVRTQWKNTKDTGNYKFTDKFNITDKINLVWRNSYVTSNKVIAIHCVLSKTIIILEKQNTYLASKVKDWEPLTTSQFIGSPLLVPWTCALSALILSLSSSLKELILKYSWILFLNKCIRMSNKFRISELVDNRSLMKEN